MNELKRVAGAVETLMRNLVEHPDDLKVSIVRGLENTIILNVTVSPNDQGRVVGQGGRTARAFRSTRYEGPRVP